MNLSADELRRKLKKILDDNCGLFFDDELDYEYSKENEDNDILYTCAASSLCSSQHSSPYDSRVASPIEVINLTDDDDDNEPSLSNNHTFIKLIRDNSYKSKDSFVTIRNKKWKFFINPKLLTRWRIRSLDVIFSRDTKGYILPPDREISFNFSLNEPLPEIEDISSMNIVIKNDLFIKDDLSMETELPSSSLESSNSACDNKSVQNFSIQEPCRFTAGTSSN